MNAAPARRIIVSSVSSDAHTWNLVFLQLLLEERGAEVTNLGACTPDETILRACRRDRPDLLVISTVNGHGHLDGLRLIRGIRRDPALASLPVVIGGKLGVRGRDDTRLIAPLAAAGFDAVFAEDSEDVGDGGLAAFDGFLLSLPTAEAAA